MISKSGLGQAIDHQKRALESQGISYTTDPEDDYDIAHINYYLWKSYNLAKQLQGKTPIVYHAHSTEEDFRNSFIGSNEFSPLFKKWIIHCYNTGDVIITPTPYSKRLLEGYGIQKPIHAISNGIDLQRFRYEKNDRINFRKQYGFSDEDKVIMSIGLYIERKGILDFVELAKRLPQYQFIWFGDSPSYSLTIKIREALQTKLPNLHFPGYVEGKHILEAYGGCDLFLFMTHEETEGIPILEASAMKTKSLIRDIPVFEDWLQDGIHTYKAKSLEEFEDKIHKILNGELPNLTEEAYKVAEERKIENIGIQLKALYESLLEE